MSLAQLFQEEGDAILRFIFILLGISFGAISKSNIWSSETSKDGRC